MTPPEPTTAAPAPPARRRRAQGEKTYRAILAAAVDIASVEGLEGLSIGRLAAELGMSKSGLFAHFGSKEDLQLKTIDAARVRFNTEVVKPALTAPAGIERLLALCEAWFSYGDRKVFRGGCFFAAATLEFDGRPGQVRDRLAQAMQHWLAFLARLIRQAQERGELDPDIDPEQLAFELHSLFWGANWMLQLYDHSNAIQHAKTAIQERLNRLRR
ncbi:MAG TPA: TetR/AcrR family transcriptional regulator [Chroococcidiopsis sp.]